MEASNITCPRCKGTIPLTAAIEQPIIEKLRARYDAEAREQQKELERVAREKVSVELRDLEQQIAEKSLKLHAAEQAELQFRKEQRQLDEQKAAFELDKARQLDAERAKIRQEAAVAATERASVELRELHEKLSQKDKMLHEAQQAELKLRQEREHFEQQKREFELELARRADEIRLNVKREKDDEFRLKLDEKDQQLQAVTRQLDEAKRKAEQRSQQTQGEVLELDLEGSLRRCFAADDIVPVSKGSHGGDLLQQVRDESGHDCGRIIWECKRAKNFSEGWLEKLKDDKLAARAQIAVLVSTAMPRDVPGFACRENVWIVPPNLSLPLAEALRLALLESACAKRAIDGRHDKMEVVYDYLSGPDFKERVIAIVEAFTAMRDDLEAEKKAMFKLWAKREKQLQRVMTNTAGMHGDLSGIIGSSLPAIETLELAALPSEPNEPAPAQLIA